MKDYAVVIGSDKDIPFNYTINDIETLKTVKKAGFRKVFLSYKYGGWSEHQKYMFDYAKQLELEVLFIHLSYKTDREIESIWHTDAYGDKVIDGFINDLTEIKKLGLNLVVMHVSKTTEKPKLSELGLKRWKRLIKHAEKIGVTIAFENTVWPNVLEYIFDNIQSNNIKICYDAGHDHAFFKDTFDFNRFKNLIAATHLHDNDSNDDDHLIPYDGTIDWKHVTDELKNSNYNFNLITESVYRDFYTNKCTPLQFYKKLFKRLKKIEKLMK